MRMVSVSVLVMAVMLAHGIAAAANVPTPTMTPPVTVVPSTGLPSEVSVDRSNANLAVANYGGRFFLVFRTAKWQIADDNARLYVVSSTDQVHWRYEGAFSYGRDLREPRFLVWHGHLFLYFALLGSNAAAFQPGGELAAQYWSPGKLTTPARITPLDDFIAWSFKVYGGRPYMLGYTGGGGTFQPNPPPKYVYWMTTEDGFTWKPVNPEHPIVYTGQCGETDFAFLSSGAMVTACQTEEVDALGWGAKVCTAPASATWQWTCRGDRRRLDSPYVFVENGYPYVIARRQPNFGGYYDLLMTNLPDTDAQFAAYDGAYAATTNRCSLWSIDPATRGFEPLVDVPGTGDTCYPQIIPESNHHYLVYNYTSPLNTDPPWGTALTTGTTQIYHQTLAFPSVPKPVTRPPNGCPRRRSLRFHLAHSRGDRITAVTVTLGRRRVLTRRGRSLSSVFVRGVRPNDTIAIVTRSAKGVRRTTTLRSIACHLTRETTVARRARPGSGDQLRPTI